MSNRIAVLMIIVTASSLLFTPFEVEGRGGGRGGGRGTYRGGHTMNRTPTMSRASNKPSRSSISQGAAQPSRQTIKQRPSAANRSELRNQVNRYAQNRPTKNINSQLLKQKAQNFSSKRSNQITQNRQLSDKVSQSLQQSRPGFNQWFNQNFFDRHNIDMGYVGTGANWWKPAAWTTLATWGTWRWSTPYYYDDGGYAYPLSTTEVNYSDPYNTPTTYSQSGKKQSTSIDQNAASSTEDWLPLGVFAVANNPHAAVYANRFVQLAINRSGEIAGVLYNSTTDTAQDITGMVDPTNQRASWLMANRIDSPMASTGIYNLTEDQTPINVHFTDGSEQVWNLVRLQE